MPSPAEVLLFQNGNAACFVRGEQVPEVQGAGWFGPYLDHLEAHGIDVEASTFEVQGGVRLKVLRNPDGSRGWEASRAL